MKKYVISAGIGTVIMGVGCFMSCLAATAENIHIGDGLIIIGVIFATYGFSKWNP